MRGVQDEQLLHAVLSYGTNWSTIAASHSPKRATLALKNRYSTLRLRNQNARCRATTATSSSLSMLQSGDTISQQSNGQKESPFGSKGIAGDDEIDDDDENEDEGGEDDEYECSPSSSLLPHSRPSSHISSYTIDVLPPISSASDIWTSFNECSHLLNFPSTGPHSTSPGSEQH
jgi:hypothetical protein